MAREGSIKRGERDLDHLSKATLALDSGQ